MWVVVIAVIGRLWNDRIIRDSRISGTSALIRRKEAESITDSRIYGLTEIKTEQKRYKNMDKENKLILYKDEEGRVSVNTRFADEDVWLTQAQLVEIYQSSKSNISEHIKHIFEDKELDEAVSLWVIVYSRLLLYASVAGLLNGYMNISKRDSRWMMND